MEMNSEDKELVNRYGEMSSLSDGQHVFTPKDEKMNKIIFENPNIDRCFEIIIEHIRKYYHE